MSFTKKDGRYKIVLKRIIKKNQGEYVISYRQASPMILNG
jgi:hypothetical protein